MKISARWLRQLFPFDVEVAEAAQVLTATGLEVEGVETVEDVPGGLRGVVVGLAYYLQLVCRLILLSIL